MKQQQPPTTMRIVIQLLPLIVVFVVYITSGVQINNNHVGVVMALSSSSSMMESCRRRNSCCPNQGYSKITAPTPNLLLVSPLSVVSRCCHHYRGMVTSTNAASTFRNGRLGGPQTTTPMLMQHHQLYGSTNSVNNNDVDRRLSWWWPSLLRKRAKRSLREFFDNNLRRVWRKTLVASIVCLYGLVLSLSPPPVNAATAAPTTTTNLPVQSTVATSSSTSLSFMERMLEQTSPSIDTIIDRYVQQHMFDDDDIGGDVTASTYQEAYDDVMTGRYPNALKEITRDLLKGTSSSPLSSITSDRSSWGTNIGSIITSIIRVVQRKTGWSEMGITMALAGVLVVAGPSLFLLAGIMVGNISKRNMDQLFKKRYGDTYTVDATIKSEPIVEAPSDDDDDDEDDSNDDDDDDDDDEDEDSPTDKSRKNKK